MMRDNIYEVSEMRLCRTDRTVKCEVGVQRPGWDGPGWLGVVGWSLWSADSAMEFRRAFCLIVRFALVAFELKQVLYFSELPKFL